MRTRARIPFGYRIVNGKAEVDTGEADKLKRYFRLYLGGLSMAEAAREAGLQCSATTYRNLLRREEYVGTDYYPPIITADYQEQLMAEWEKRKGESPRQPPVRVAKGVQIYTDFRMAKSQGDVHNFGVGLDTINLLYQQIRPVMKTAV